MARRVAVTGQGFPDFVTRVQIGTQSTRVVEPIQSVRRIGSLGLQFGGSVLRAQKPLGPGSTWAGSWQASHAFQSKTFAVYTLGGSPSGNGGSLALVVGLTGTGAANMTGTYFGPALIKRGSITSYTVTDPFKYIRPVFVQSGYRRGTLSLGYTRQA